MRKMTAHGSLHLARKSEQVPQGLGDLGSSKGTCPLCSVYRDLPLICYSVFDIRLIKLHKLSEIRRKFEIIIVLKQIRNIINKLLRIKSKNVLTKIRRSDIIQLSTKEKPLKYKRKSFNS